MCLALFFYPAGALSFMKQIFRVFFFFSLGSRFYCFTYNLLMKQFHFQYEFVDGAAPRIVDWVLLNSMSCLDERGKKEEFHEPKIGNHRTQRRRKTMNQ
jgi:hypothetical protein